MSDSYIGDRRFYSAYDGNYVQQRRTYKHKVNGKYVWHYRRGNWPNKETPEERCMNSIPDPRYTPPQKDLFV